MFTDRSKAPPGASESKSESESGDDDTSSTSESATSSSSSSSSSDDSADSSDLSSDDIRPTKPLPARARPAIVVLGEEGAPSPLPPAQ